MTELADALGLEGFERGLFNSVTTTITHQLLTNVDAMVELALTSDKAVDASMLFAGFKPTEIFRGVSGAVGGYLGSYLASQIIVADNKQASIGTSIGSSIGAFIGTSILGPGLGSFIGSFIGNILGTALGNAFGVDEKSWGSVSINAHFGQAVAGDYGSDNMGSSRTFEAITVSQAQTVNRIVDFVGAEIIGIDEKKGNGRVDYWQKGTTYTVFMPDNTAYDFISRLTPDPDAAWAAVADDGVMRLLRNAQLQGGDFIKRWAFDNSKAKNVGTLLLDIEAAASYLKYLRNPEKINFLLKEAPKTPFAMGWAATLLRARELGLHKIRELETKGDSLDNRIGGTALIDTIRGLGGNDRITGKQKNDTLFGGNGNDTLSGGTEDDLLSGDADNDLLSGGAGRDTLRGDSGADTLKGGNDDDTLEGGTGNDSLHGGNGNDRLVGEAWDDLLEGGAGDDTLLGGSDYDTLRGGSGNDRLDGEGHDDLLEGGDGDDTLKGGSGHDELYGGSGNDHLSGATGKDVLYGESGDDSLEGGDGSDEINGGDGDDTLEGGAGLDWMVGGSGNDHLDGGGDTDMVLGGAGEDVLKGGDGDDTLEGGAGGDRLEGSDGNDRLRGDSGQDTLYGHDGHDDLDGGEEADVLYGGNGEDALIGSSGDDTLWGGDGQDALVGDDGADLLYGEAGNDVVKGGAGTDTLVGASGNDSMYGGADADSLSGESGEDQLYGDGGDDTLSGGIGSDKLWGGSGRDMLDGGDGNDVLTADDGDDSIQGGLGDDMLAGGAGDDTLDGGGGHDQIFGGYGNDILYGGPDVDYIDGGDDTDVVVLTGQRVDYKIRFNTAIGRFSIVDLRAGSPDGTDLADIEVFRFSEGDITKADLDVIIETDADIAWNVENSDGSKSVLGWRPTAENPSLTESFVQRRNISGVLMSETVFKPDGSRTAYASDTSADGQAEIWVSYVQNFDTQARLVRQQYENDDLSQQVEEWDPDNAHGQPWSYRDTRKTKVGQVYLEYWQLDVLDEPNEGQDPSIVDYIERLWDRGSEDWKEIVREFETYAANHWLTEEVKYDDGTRTVVGKDYQRDGLTYGGDPGLAEWISFSEKYDPANNNYWESYTYYGTTPETQYTIIKERDFSGRDWSDSTLHIDGQDNWRWKEVNYDSHPEFSQIRWDWQFVPGSWTERIIYKDKTAARRLVKQEDKWIGEDRILVKGETTQWDYTSGVTWKWQKSFYNYNRIAATNEVFRREVLYDNDQYREIEYDLYDQRSGYETRNILYTSANKELELTRETIFDRARSDGTIRTLEKWDRANESSEWYSYSTEYIRNPDSSSERKYLPQSQVQYLRPNSEERFERQWDYTSRVAWKYKLEAFNADDERYAYSYIYDDD